MSGAPFRVGKSIGFLLVISALAACTNLTKTSTASPPILARTIVMPGVQKTRLNVGVPGRIDHMAYDPVTKRLFVAALENGSLEVLDLESGRRIESISGLKQPQGAAIVPSQSCVAVACGGDGVLHVFDTHTLKELKSLEIGPDADNVRYDAAKDTVFVSYGGSTNGAIALVNARTWTKTSEIAFQSRPESFQIDSQTQFLFANLPTGVRATKPGQVAIVDRLANKTTFVQLTNQTRNFPMAYDAANHRLFIATRIPAQLITIDTQSASVIAQTPCGDDSDDLAYDPATQRVYMIAGGFRPDLQEPGTASPCSLPGNQGTLDVFSAPPNSQPVRIGSYETAPHARTGLFVPSRRAIYVAVPQKNGRDPEIREYKVD